MSSPKPLHVGYVVKRYPRYSETFIVNEILAHETAGLKIDIFSLRQPVDHHFQDKIAQVRAPVNYLLAQGVKVPVFWSTLQAAAKELPGLWDALPKSLDAPGLEVYQALTLARQVVSSGINHLHAHFATQATAVARLAARFAGVPYTFTAHAKDIFHEDVQPGDLRRKLQDASAVVTVSEFNVGFLNEHYGPDAANVRRIYNGLDLDAFPYESPQDRLPQVIAVGRLVEKKGFSVLVDACAILAERQCPFSCTIVGTGDLKAQLQTQIERLQLQETVELLGPRPLAEVIQLVQEASVMAAPCVVGEDGNRDGLPTVLLEAMALGTPCVSTDVTGIPEVIRDGQTGRVVAQHNARALADAIEQLLADDPLRVQLATRARKLIEQEFDIHRNAARIREVFRQAGQKPGETPTATLQEVR